MGDFVDMSMATLDEKLRAIKHLDCPGHAVGEDCIAAIHAAFKEDGYIKPDKRAYEQAKHEAMAKAGYVPQTQQGVELNGRVLFTVGQGLMSGQEWYDRFVKEYHMRADWISADPSMGDDAEHDVLLAAKLAAGVTHD